MDKNYRRQQRSDNCALVPFSVTQSINLGRQQQNQHLELQHEVRNPDEKPNYSPLGLENADKPTKKKGRPSFEAYFTKHCFWDPKLRPFQKSRL